MDFETKCTGTPKLYDSGMNRDTTEGKTDYTLCDLPMLKRWAELMTRGAERYGANNWRKANSQEELDRFKSSAFRHFVQWMSGEVDEDHAAAVYFNVSAFEFLKTKLGEKPVESPHLRSVG